MKFKKSRSLEAHYEDVKLSLTKDNFKCNPFRSIRYGIQFKWFKDDFSGIIRIYKSKKGSTLDLSQINDADHRYAVEYILQDMLDIPSIDANSLFKKPTQSFDPIFLKELIGVDESGKGDYFGPLCVAAVFTTPDSYQLLHDLGIKDSKHLSDNKIAQLAKEIITVTETTVLVIHNENYNAYYTEFSNINHILAWGHAKTIATLHLKTKCETFLCDQFSSSSLIYSGLMAKGIMIKPYEQTKAERNLAVAAASILARDAYIKEMHRLSTSYNQNLPKGCADHVITAAQKFLDLNGSEELARVAKLHFNVTKKLKLSS